MIGVHMDIAPMTAALTTSTWIAPIISVIFGGLAGALISGKYSSKLNIRQLTITIIKDYLEKYHDMQSECIWMIQHPEDARSLSNINVLIRFGNWGESVAVLYKNGLIDKKIIEEYGLANQLRMLYRDTVKSPLNTHAKYASLTHLQSL